MKIFTKKEIKNMVLDESKIYRVFEKKDLKLYEDDGNAYVEPSSDSSSSLTGDLAKAKSKNPNDDEFIVNANSYDGDSSNNAITLDVVGNSPNDASTNFRKLTKQPGVRQLMANSNVNAKIHLKNENIEKIKENSIPFTKKELNEILFN